MSHTKPLPELTEDRIASIAAELEVLDPHHRVWVEFARAVESELGARSTAAQPAGWVDDEEWEQLAWQLCAEEHGDEACNELIWEGGPIPEPWGDRWLKYEGEAKRMISLVRQYAPPAAAQPVERAVALLREAVTTLDMWADVAPAVSLRHDINRFLGSVAAASGDSTPPSASQVDAVELEIASRYVVEKRSGGGFWPYCVRAGDGARELFVGHKKACDNVRAALESACLDGAFMARSARGRSHHG